MAKTYTESDKMLTLINNDYHLLQIISRFEIPLGFGEKTVKEVCEENNVNTSTFLAVVNISTHGEEIIDYWTDKISLASLTKYLRKAHSYYLKYMLPTMRENLVKALDCSKKDEITSLILRFYDEYVAEIRQHMEHEEEKVFGYVDSLLSNKPLNNISLEASTLHPKKIEQKMIELKNVIIKFNISNKYNELNTALYQIIDGEEDLRMHCSLENTLFLSTVHLLEKQINGNDDLPEKTYLEDEQQDILSEREKEIIVEVAKGLANKEIADKLYISINTVTTHRRNIARKLDIHSAAGLTIYAIINNLVNIDDVKMKVSAM